MTTELVSSIEMLIACQTGSRFGLSAILLSTKTLLGDYFDGSERLKVFGWQLTAVSELAIMALFAAVFLVVQYSWRAPMAIYGPSLVKLPLAWGWVVEPSDAEKAAGDGAVRKPRSRKRTREYSDSSSLL